MKGKISGVIISPVLPFDKKGQLQEDVLGEHIDFLINAGTNALYCLGTVGEFPSMPIKQRKKVAEIIVDQVAKRVPVVLHVGTTNLIETLDLVHHSEEIGADAVYCVPPFYYTLDDVAIIDYFKKVSTSIRIPLHIYNIPRFSKISISPKAIVELAMIPKITAIKDSTGDLSQTQQLIELTDLDVFIGGELLYLAGLVMGAAGLVSGVVGPAFPEILVEFYEAYKKRNFDKVCAFQRKINMLTRIIAESHNSIPAVKEVIKLRGHRMGEVLSPLRPLTKNEIENLEKALKKIKAI